MEVRATHQLNLSKIRCVWLIIAIIFGQTNLFFISLQQKQEITPFNHVRSYPGRYFLYHVICSSDGYGFHRLLLSAVPPGQRLCL